MKVMELLIQTQSLDTIVATSTAPLNILALFPQIRLINIDHQLMDDSAATFTMS